MKSNEPSGESCITPPAARAELEPPEHGWTCFHCGEHFPNTFIGQRDAEYHFGTTPNAPPGCKLSRKEKGILAVLRNTEKERDELLDALRLLYRGQDGILPPDWSIARTTARAAIAKAMGKREPMKYSEGFVTAPDCKDRDSCTRHGVCMYLGCTGFKTYRT